MEHVVFFTGPDRSQQFRRTPSLDEAVRFVESLRNGEGIDDSKVYALTEVPLRFQTYYRVEVPADAASSATSAPAALPAPEPFAPPAAPTMTAPAAPEPARAPDALPPPEALPAPESLAPPVAEAIAEPMFEPVAEPVFEPVAAATGEQSPGGASADLSAESSTAPSPLADGDAPDSANGKPSRGLGFFAR